LVSAENKESATARLASSLDRVSQARRISFGAPDLAAAYLSLKQWQAVRLARTYADLLDHPRYREAAEFFLSDLYGAKDYSQRDADVARILPKLAAVLPAAALSTIADAVELDALSEELDGALVAQLMPAKLAAITAPDYARAYRACANRPAREHQIVLMRHIGDALDGLTRMPLLEGSLRLMRRPANLAGFSHLQSFLERGFGAFKRMGGAKPFLDIVQARETRLMEALFTDTDNPFAGLDAETIS
jgi:hypothetical protein